MPDNVDPGSRQGGNNRKQLVQQGPEKVEKDWHSPWPQCDCGRVVWTAEVQIIGWDRCKGQCICGVRDAGLCFIAGGKYQ